jgi:hypothetical protein
MSELPEEVAAFLIEAGALRDPARRINPLTPRESVEHTERYRRIPVVDALGLIVLDDANDSNPYCFVDEGTARGMVLHLSHDSGPRFRYQNLDEFLSAIRQARSLGLGIDLLPHPALSPHPDQAAIRRILTSQVDAADDDAASTFALFVVRLDPGDIETLELSAKSPDFFIREAVARFLADTEGPAHHALATQLSRDEHPQVSSSAGRALAALKRRRTTSR